MSLPREWHMPTSSSKGLKDGYDSPVGERGIKLSGGQRQRIAIARVMLKDPPILILDEATSSFDSITEKAIQDSLDRLTGKKTVIVAAHRLSTIAHLDRILVFDRGRIVEDGSHGALLAARGFYYTLWTMQAEGFLPDTRADLSPYPERRKDSLPEAMLAEGSSAE